MPTPGNLFAAIVFGAIGMGAFVYGKKAGALGPALIGVALMVYPYLVPDALTWLIGLGLTGCLFVFRE